MLNRMKRAALTVLAVVMTVTALPVASVKAAVSSETQSWDFKFESDGKKYDTLYVGQVGLSVWTPCSSRGEYSGLRLESHVFDPKMTFSSSNPSVLKVDSKGNLTPVKPGKATITCTSQGNAAKATYTVKDPKRFKSPIFKQEAGFEYGKTYKISTLNGYKIKKIALTNDNRTCKAAIIGNNYTKRISQGIKIIGKDKIQWTPSHKRNGYTESFYFYITLSNGTVVGRRFYGTTKTAAVVKNTVKEVMQTYGITMQSPEKEKILAVAMWLQQNTEYDFDLKHNCPYSIFWKKEGTCSEYTTAISAFCDELGIANTSIDAPNHFLSAVYVDGHWYGMDGTYFGHTRYNNPYLIYQAPDFLLSDDDTATPVSKKSEYKGITFDHKIKDDPDYQSFCDRMSAKWSDKWLAWDQQWEEEHPREDFGTEYYDSETNSFLSKEEYLAKYPDRAGLI